MSECSCEISCRLPISPCCLSQSVSFPLPLALYSFRHTHKHKRPLCLSGGHCITDSCFKSHWGDICDPDTRVWQCLRLLLTCSTDFSPTATSRVSLISPIILLGPQLSADSNTVLCRCPSLFPSPHLKGLEETIIWEENHWVWIGRKNNQDDMLMT